MTLTEGFPLERKQRYFTATGLFSVKTVADRHGHTVIVRSTSDELFNGVNIDDLECP